MDTPTPLFGRASEIRRLCALVDGAGDRGAALVVRGEPGIGKSALLLEADRAARIQGMRILSTAGVESETKLPFAALQQLLRPVLDQADVLPEPQRNALLAALGITETVVPDLFLIALAVLNLLGEVATTVPVLVVVEDAHWLDKATADVLAFVARRLESEPVVLLAAMRDGFADSLADSGLPELELQRLDDAAAATLLEVRAPDLAPSVRDWMLTEAAGNPLALVELPITMVRIGTTGQPWSPLTTRLERAFADRLAGLPDVTRTVLLVAALNDGDSLAEILDAAAVVSGTQPRPEDLSPAMAVGLLDIKDAHVRFRHPLMRSAIHQSFGPSPRFAVHAALARVLSRQADRSVWHRAASCSGPDEDVADRLDAAAANAQRRGGIVAAVNALERAAQLSVDPAHRFERLLHAAELAFELGRRDVVVRLLAEVAPDDLTPRQRSRMACVLEGFSEGVPDTAAGAWSLAELAEQVADEGDLDLALKLLWGAARRCFWAEPGRQARARVISAAETIEVHELDPRLLTILAFAAPIDRGAVVIERLQRLVALPAGDAQASSLLSDAATLVGAYELALSFSDPSLTALRAQGRIGLVARSLATLTWSALHLADLSVAIPAAEEAERLASETSQPLIGAVAKAMGSMLAALRGDQDRAEGLATEAEQIAVPIAANAVLSAVQLARGVAALADGRHLDAYRQLRRMHDPADVAFHLGIRCFAVAELAEAAARCGEQDAVAAIVADVEAAALLSPAPSLHASLSLARALLADDAAAEELYLAALRSDLRRSPFVHARIQLAYGEWLRRRRRPSESRAYLRTARETFDALGIIPWGERARRQLRASGETSRRRSVELLDRLTPQELQIARMAAEGMTNREIGQKLYLSHRTIGSHLHRVFPKLGITSRSALGAAMETPG